MNLTPHKPFRSPLTTKSWDPYAIKHCSFEQFLLAFRPHTIHGFLTMTQQGRSIRLSEDLLRAAKLRARRLGFETWSDYVKSLLRYDCLVSGQEHSVTAPIARKRLAEQDRIDEELRKLVESDGEGLRGVYLEHVLERVAERRQVPKEELREGLDQVDEWLTG